MSQKSELIKPPKVELEEFGSQTSQMSQKSELIKPPEVGLEEFGSQTSQMSQKSELIKPPEVALFMMLRPTSCRCSVYDAAPNKL